MIICSRLFTYLGNRALFFLALDIHILKYDQIYKEQLSWLKSQSFFPKQQVKQVYSCF